MSEDDLIQATIVPNEEDRARMAVNAVLREESTDVTTKFMAFVKNRLKLTDTAFQNIQAVQSDLMNPEVYNTLTNSEKLKFLQVLISQMHILEVPLEEQKITINQINAQINNVLNSEKHLVQLPRSSRAKLKDTLLELMKSGFVDENPKL